MPGTHLFEYAVVRIVPRVEREEFFNAGVVLYCKDKQFLQLRYSLPEQRLRAFGAETDLVYLEACLASFDNICKGIPEGGPIARLDAASRFRWLTATRSTVVQTSKVHPGLCEDAGATLNRLFGLLVL